MHIEFEPQEATALLSLLDRVPTTGRQEALALLTISRKVELAMQEDRNGEAVMVEAADGSSDD